ncbi:MAG: hypothetical protein ACRD3Q_12855 [Terriglobales bacterium]
MAESRFSCRSNYSGVAGKLSFVFLSLLAWAALACAQAGHMSPNQGESDGVNAGGNWLEFQSTDKMTGHKIVRFELQSNNYFREDKDYKPRVNLVCDNGKLKVADFNPGFRLPPPNRPGWWGQPQIEVQVRIDDVHYSKGWNWLRGRYLSMDKGTVRGMLGAQVFNIALPMRRGREIAEFSPAGLDLGRVREACDLRPKKPSED